MALDGVTRHGQAAAPNNVLTNFKWQRHKSGLVTASAKLRTLQERAYTDAPVLGQRCPLAGFRFLQVSEFEGADVRGGYHDYTVQYGGTDQTTDPSGGGDLDESSIDFELERSTNLEPIETNAAFSGVSAEDLNKIYALKRGQIEIDQSGAYKLAQGGNKYEVITFSGATATLADKILKGFTRYYAPSQIWKVSYASLVPLTAVQLGDIGKIATPFGDPPTPAGHDWLLLGATQRATIGTTEPVSPGDPPLATAFQSYFLTFRWLLSGPDGWDTDIYS